jgi:hypothetical protein
MKLVKHFERGYGHARKSEDGIYWYVSFFDDYLTTVVFRTFPNTKVLTFLTENNDYDE